MLNVTVNLNARSLGNLQGRINSAAQGRADRVAAESADEMQKEVVRIIARELINDRPGHRRKGGMKIINSFEGVVLNENTPRVVARLRTRRGARHRAVAALNFGWDPFVMEPRNKDFLWMPEPGTNRAHQAYHRVEKRFPFVVNKGHAGYNFMGRAREHVRQQLGR